MEKKQETREVLRTQEGGAGTWEAGGEIPSPKLTVAGSCLEEESRAWWEIQRMLENVEDRLYLQGGKKQMAKTNCCCYWEQSCQPVGRRGRTAKGSSATTSQISFLVSSFVVCSGSP